MLLLEILEELNQILNIAVFFIVGLTKTPTYIVNFVNIVPQVFI